jgi:Tfp pilus assembly protein PilF
MLEYAQETLETAQEMFNNAVERAAYELEYLLTQNKGFTLLQM